jgi:hypothetical protein
VFDQFLGMQARAVACTPAGLLISATGRSLGGLVLACLLLAGCASAGGSPSPVASEQGSPTKGDATLAQAVAGSSTASAAALVADPVVLQRRRQAIARMLEGNEGYRTILDDGALRLTNAKIAGPIEYQHRVFAPTKVTVYCVSADLGFPLIIGRSAEIHVEKAGNGSERLRATIDIVNTTLWACGRPNYEPFPEMEQLRAQRRKAL